MSSMQQEAIVVENEICPKENSEKKIDLSKSSQIDVEEQTETSDEDMGDEEAEENAKCEAIQAAVALEVRAWLEDHGPKIVALEWSKKSVRDKKAALKGGSEPSHQFIQEKDLKRNLSMESQIVPESNKRRRIGTRVR